MDWSVILDGFVLLMQVTCFAFLVYGFLLCVQSASMGEHVEPGPRPPVTDPVDVEAIVEWAHRERSLALGRFIVALPVRAWRLASQLVGSLRSKEAAKFAR